MWQFPSIGQFFPTTNSRESVGWSSLDQLQLGDYSDLSILVTQDVVISTPVHTIAATKASASIVHWTVKGRTHPTNQYSSNWNGT